MNATASLLRADRTARDRNPIRGDLYDVRGQLQSLPQELAPAEELQAEVILATLPVRSLDSERRERLLAEIEVEMQNRLERERLAAERQAESTARGVRGLNALAFVFGVLGLIVAMLLIVPDVRYTRPTSASCSGIDFPMREVSLDEIARQIKRAACAAHRY